MASDYSREIHGGYDDDRPSTGECLAETIDEIAKLEAGDVSGVAPWSTPEETLAWLYEQKASYEAQLNSKR